MDLALTEEQELLRHAARDFLQKECPEGYVREMEDDSLGYRPAVWRKMADLGWQGLAIPEAYGGAGFGFLDLVVLIEEFGRALVPGPFLSTLIAATALLEGGSELQKQQFLPGLASGEIIGTFALVEPAGRYSADGVMLRAEKQGGDYVLNGTKLFVSDAHVADLLIVVARTGGVAEEGISVFLVDARAPGVATRVLKTIASDKLCEVTFSDVRVAADSLLGGEGEGWAIVQRVAQKAACLEAAHLVGLAQMDFEISIDYAKERVQFGRPIGSFQAIQHKAADMVTDVDGARFIMYRAAAAVADGEPDADVMVSMAKAWVSDASRRVVAHGQQIHGGIGFTKDYKIQLYFRR
jgi:alkylation response protein AidB-like acyl-CoA dehydrogenase